MTPHSDLTPPSDAELGMLEQALLRSGHPPTDEDLLDVMTWLAQVELSLAWLALIRAGLAALVVNDHHVKLVPNSPEEHQP
jgi:hypothetical protein